MKEIGIQGLQKESTVSDTPEAEIDTFFRTLDEEQFKNNRLRNDILKNDEQAILWNTEKLPSMGKMNVDAKTE